MCRAAWSLAAALRRLDPGGGQGRGLSPYLLQMRVAQVGEGGGAPCVGGRERFHGRERVMGELA